jgi:ABC-2 type transport system ATP-binding protein/lipopolysaccharide transport system ATP-binding protein
MSFIVMDDVCVDFPVYDSDKSFRKTLIKQARNTARVTSQYTGGMLRQEGRGKPTSIRALHDINLKLSDGDRLGLIGHNGAGKTTLLKLMAGIYEPTQGFVETSGRVSPMFNPSIGMDPDDTGYENILNIGLFLGLTEEEIIARFPEIEEFTELGSFLSLPVRIYSSGMTVRLAFAIATSIDPEILILDEGLGAGDARFAEKAKRRMNAMVERASIVVLASHGPDLIQTMCNKAVLMEHGRIVKFGECAEVIDAYDRAVQESI